jgi:intracellular multiplication protein IcmE
MNPDNPNDLSSHDPLNFDEDDALFAQEDRLNENHDEPRGPSLSEIIHNNPSLKIFGVVLVLGIFLIVFMVFGGSEEPNPSVVNAPGSVSQPPGTAQLPPAYEEAVRTASEQRAVNAELTGGSAFPTPIGTPERIEAPPVVENVDPLAEWRRAAEERANERRQQVDITEPASVNPIQIAEPPPAPIIQQQPVVVQQQQPPAPPPLPTGPNEQDITAMQQRFTQQMQTVMEAQVPYAFNLMTQGIPTGFEPVSAESQRAAAQAATQNAQSNAAQNNAPRLIIAAGTVGYAQTLIEANSDVPGPILAELASGPLSGARLIGSFQMASNRYLTLRFTRAIYKGREYSIDAYALDPQTTLGAIATDVDRHYFSRIVIPAAARFLQGYAQAVSQRGTTVVVNNSSTIASQEPLDGKEQAIMGASEAINQVSNIVQQDLANRPVTVKVATGTRIGLLFVSAVTTASNQNPNLLTGYDASSPYAQYNQQAGVQTPASIHTTNTSNDPRIYVEPQPVVRAPPPAIPANNPVMVVTPSAGN